MSDDPRDPLLENVLSAHADAILDSMFGCLPGTIVSYNASNHTASVQPSLQRGRYLEDGTRTADTLPVINDVTVMWPGTAAARISFPLVAGDPVLILFCGMSLATWKGTTGISDSGDDRRHDYTDAICIPGCANPIQANDGSPQITFTGVDIQIGGSSPLVTQAQFMNHTHLTAGTGAPVAPTAISPTPTLTGTKIIKGA